MFWRDGLVVDGRQVTSLVSVHGRGSLFDTNGLLRLSYASYIPGSRRWCYPWTPSALWPNSRLLPIDLSKFVCSLNIWLSGLFISLM